MPDVALAGAHFEGDSKVNSPSSSTSWRIWSEHASPELLEAFQSRTLAAVTDAQRPYGRCAPESPEYRAMKEACSAALDDLAYSIQEKHDALYQNL
jgi:hypothetical protein